VTHMAGTLYGISNCDTVKKARAFLAAQGIDVVFHDYKKLGVPADELAAWVRHFGWEKVLNRKGNTWRQLAPEQQAQVVDAPSAMALMQAQPSVIRRPVLAYGGRLLLGFDAAEWATLKG
jgi:arsenate reductase